ncbi:MAG: exodeoxyribonuclease VII small subunit [Euryarchaeota archaeon]|nr:exodeoxyribonuclease VII small subunit [Euryarchaeota archaeon]
MPKDKVKNNFEDSIGRLEKLVDNMESGESSLEQNLAWFEEGMELIKICQGHLTDAEHHVQELIKNNDQIPEDKDAK